VEGKHRARADHPETAAEEQAGHSMPLRERIQTAANKALERLPSAATLEESIQRQELSRVIVPTGDLALFLREARRLLEECTQANGWDDNQLRYYTRQTELLQISVAACIELMEESDSGLLRAAPEEEGGRSCTAQCKDERDQCILDDCGPDTEWPCGCCVPCNATWIACLTDCILE
jgi:hypothetical protein